MKKKSYNPFKMWGSYVVSFLTTIAFLLWRNGFNCNESSCNFILADVLDFTGFSLYSQNNYAGIVIVGGCIVVGFLLGWGIHSLIRAIRK